MRNIAVFATAFVLAAAAFDAAAANKTIYVGGYTSGGGGGYYGGGGDTPNYVFSPPNVTIDVGDTVTFKNLGGIAIAHNVEAPGLFRCANGCDGDGHGGDGTPAFNEWTFTVTLTQPGTITFYCDNHRVNGMTGTITVNEVAPPPPTQPIVGGISGNWFNPSANQGGYGFQIEVLPNNGLLAIWFVFNPAGTAQNWLFSQGSYTPGASDVVLPVFLEQGGAFPPNFNGANITAPAWGSLELKFTDCNNGTAEYTPNEAAVNAQYGHLQFPIQRVTSIAGATCP